MFPRASYKMVNKQLRGERDSLICLGKDYLGAADPGKRKILTWVCPQGVPRVNGRADSLWSPRWIQEKSVPECVPHYCGLGEIIYPPIMIKVIHLHCKIFREFREVEKNKKHPLILIPKKTPLTFSSIVLFYIFLFHIYICKSRDDDNNW